MLKRRNRETANINSFSLFFAKGRVITLELVIEKAKSISGFTFSFFSFFSQMRIIILNTGLEHAPRNMKYNENYF